MKRAMSKTLSQITHYIASSPEKSGQAIEYLKKLKIIMR